MINGVDIRWSKNSNKKGPEKWTVIVSKHFGPFEYTAEVDVAEPFDGPQKFAAAERAALQVVETQMAKDGVIG